MVEVHITVTALAVFVIIIILFLVGLLFYLNPTSNRLTTIPGPSVCDDKEGNINDIERAGSFHQYLCELHKDYGDVAAFKYGSSFVVSVANSDHFAPRYQLCDLPDFLFEAWRPLVGDQSFLFVQGVEAFKRRGYLDYNVTAASREHFAKLFRSLSDELIKKWRGLPEGQHIPLSQHMKGLATKAVCRMMFSDYFDDDKKLIKLHAAWELCWNEVIASNKAEPTKSEGVIVKSRKDLHALIENAIDHQWKNTSKAKQSLSLIKSLLDASNKHISAQELLADVLTMFTVGLQVTWAVLTWSCHYVIMKQSVQEDLRRELLEIDSLDVMPESLGNMKILKCIIKESIRCSAMFTCSGRVHDLDVTLDKHVVPKQTPIIEAISVGMRNEEVWNEPYKFDPDRFVEEEESQLNPLDFIPFSFAANKREAHSSLVYLLTSVVLASLFREFKLRPAGAESSCADPNYEGFVVMPTKEEIWAVIATGSEDVELVG